MERSNRNSLYVIQRKCLRIQNTEYGQSYETVSQQSYCRLVHCLKDSTSFFFFREKKISYKKLHTLLVHFHNFFYKLV